jgi:hypothetical protein
MYAVKILHKILKEKLPFVHKSRLSCLMLAVETLLRHNKLSLVALGRNILNNISARDNIKKIDRLLGNKHLYKELVYFYEVLKRNLKITKKQFFSLFEILRSIGLKSCYLAF